MRKKRDIKIARTRSVQGLLKIYQSLDGRSRHVPGIGLVLGEAGIGKTTAVTWLRNQCNCLIIECNPLWTPHSMLGDIAAELGESTGGGSTALLNRLVAKLRLTGRGLVLDECDDRLFASGRKYHQMIDCLRALHDRTGVPLIFVGYLQARRTISLFPQLQGRVTQEIEFERLDLEDTQKFIDCLSDCQIESDLLEEMFISTQGRPRQTVTAIENINALAREQQWESVSAEKWGAQPFFPGDRR
ncbi:AAA family ATPase [Synechococcales cyanobacterium C]|uniref:AAA family ATPase n=1 Tax=Petrachloros mirabilis ULC683 TaxID=2781853 RepID=A0A8K2ABT9_9CYAN|nr:ATP-binding protein [Petrachloros mirabilis]NCJ05175.1 AAA family ATPase [Petrachloros mirabilis ULC683]